MSDEATGGAVKGGVFDDMDEIRRQKIEEQKKTLLAQAEAEKATGVAKEIEVTPPVIAPDAASVVATPPTETVDSLRAENARQTARLAQLEREVSDTGRRGHELELLRQDRVKLAALLDEQARKVAELEQRIANPPPPPEPEFELGEPTRNLLGAEEAARLEGEIRKLRKQAKTATPSADPALTKEIEALKADTASAKQAAAATAKGIYLRDLKTRVTNYETLVAMPEYAQFFEQRLRGTPYKRGEILLDADARMDADTVAEHLLDFAESVKARVATPPPPIVPARPTAVETVNTNQGAAAVVPPKVASKRLSASEIEAKEAEADKHFDMAVGSGATSREDRVKHKAIADALYAEIEAAKKET